MVPPPPPPPPPPLVRTLAVVALAAGCPACLVVEPPQYEPPPKTPPFLVAAAADPPLSKPIRIDGDDTKVLLRAAVFSEDNGDDVELALYINYGQRNAQELPYRKSVYPFPPVDAGTIAQGARSFDITWFLDSDSPLPQCQTVTMIATHEFNSDVCPAAAEDFSTLVWEVINCDVNDPSCPKECLDFRCATQPCPTCETPFPERAAQ
jgi:hypothetical protein